MANLALLVGLTVVLSSVVSVMSRPADDSLLTSKHPSTDDQEWEKFKVKFERNYKTPEEEAMRKALFMKTVKLIREHNDKYQKGESTYTLGVTNFSDWTDDESKSHSGPQPVHLS